MTDTTKLAPPPEQKPVERCPCGYPMPCSKSVPVQFCRALKDKA